ncbi:UMP kinase [Candidatus Uhrbacteria bacterium CG_4_9_14_0_2_um_filter_41_50]|uniref:Uridylate kinase n=1 Tax=Candidatus Uhrbacteria bacterium CG_4_9_14_0_2_um_filter_41_50 TaxID=1975031 RepID=A0A2M8ENX1_9BACT|nr:MAG: UMP kinase [Candidatus Uhrbacteria bacterium CG_4_10_14_3_um_filter_41_21]PIZ54568.1 MAG: UMP kinase [Candidatus Uhrbacteria bacterium CG_4_10_14_0_2_um_filter_41_21]PJB84495.1 MAG: UMP kinase [Candidatus Uhrbacteria bacterium CG_4_9_14_0_8_um_filter_41_16]PJC24443.1 MAG: UMP kinase [Candidatus Uhrbacteria bacterium CG_4_9_14_0_2_um_filter_41_50]PJE75096.1 MAG: UMP kinase [Candidatus Uhrbacteria bacterium CG10_big_fil_rev_8_21_14_0_10_41_26]
MSKIVLQKNKPIILSIGGSLIVPSGSPDVMFLKALKKFVDAQIKIGNKIVIVSGGGKTARHYIDAASGVQKVVDEDLDWLGIHATRLNGHLLRTIFRKVAHPAVIKDPTKTPRKWKSSVLIAAGWKPGWSTDYVACRIAKRLGVDMVINASNIDYVYDKDPKKFKDAVPVEEMRWKAFQDIVGYTWHPGTSAPFDVVASGFCHRNKMKVAIVNGDDFKNISALVAGRGFRGTILE